MKNPLHCLKGEELVYNNKDYLNPCCESCMWLKDTPLTVRLSSEVSGSRCESTLAASVSYLFFLNPCLRCWHLMHPTHQQRDFFMMAFKPDFSPFGEGKKKKKDLYFNKGKSFIEWFESKAQGTLDFYYIKFAEELVSFFGSRYRHKYFL